MKTTILKYIAACVLSGFTLQAESAVRHTETPAAPYREIPADSLHPLCGGRLPLHTSGGRLWLEVPHGEIRITAQIDRGAGLRGSPLRCVPPFRMAAKDTLLQLVFADTAAVRQFGATELATARIAGTERRVADITAYVLEAGRWYDSPERTLRGQCPGHERLTGAEATPRGTLLHLRSYYYVELPDRGVEIQIPTGALPLDISLLLSLPEEMPAPPREVVVGSSVPEEYAEPLAAAVAEYNRRHRKNPLRLVPDNGALHADTPFAVSFDATERRIEIFAERDMQGKSPVFARIRLGTDDWSQEALRHSLHPEVSPARMRRLLRDEDLRRKLCLRSAFGEALQEVFDPQPVADTLLTEAQIGRVLRGTGRRIAFRERLLHREGDRISETGGVSERELSRLFLSEAQETYIRLARRAQGDRARRIVAEWIAGELTKDAEGRFDTPRLRNSGQQTMPAEHARRCSRVWEALFASVSPEALARLPEIFHDTLQEHPEAAFAVQDACIGALLRAVEKRPELGAAADNLAAFYTAQTGAEAPRTALFARMQSERLHENRNDKTVQP